MNKSLALALFTAAATSLGNARAQSGGCANATPIQTTGQWSWYTGLGGVGPPFSPGTSCEFLPGYVNYFFEWTAPNSGHFQIDTVGSSVDTQLAVYSGPGCTGTCLAYNYQAGSVGTGFFPNFDSSIILLRDVTAGDVFLIRVGGQPIIHPPDAKLTISAYTDPCIYGIDDALEENDWYQSASPLGYGTYANLWASHADPDFYRFSIAPGATLSVDLLFDHTNGNLDARLYAINPSNPSHPGLQIEDSVSFSNNEHITWTNTSSTNEVVLLVNVSPFGSASDCNTYDMVVGGQFSTATFCDPMNVNSTGLPTIISAHPSASAGTGLRLEASQGPPSQFAYFLGGNQFTEPGIPLGGGRFCIQVGTLGHFGRYNVWNSPLNSLGRFQPDGTLNNIVGTSDNSKGFDVPTELPFAWPSGQTNHVMPGETWHFQLWHREANGSSNFSNGLSVTF